MTERVGPNQSAALLPPVSSSEVRPLRVIVGDLLGHPPAPPARVGRIRAVIYARFSTTGQHASSIERQIDVGSTYAASRNMVVVGVYPDYAVSGRSTVGREALARLREAAATGAFDVVIVEDIDRLSRRESDAHAILEQLTELGIELHDPRGPSKGVIFSIEASRAAENVVRLKRVAASGRRRFVIGGRSPHRTKFGYRRSRKKGELLPHPQRAPFVAEIFARYAGGVSRATIARDLTGRCPTPGDCVEIDAERADASRRSPWTSGMVREILRCPTYVGVLYDGKTRVEYAGKVRVAIHLRPVEEWTEGKVPHMRIVDPDVWIRANNRLDGERKRRGRLGKGMARGPADSASSYLLRGLAVCGCCGEPLRPHYGRTRALTTFRCAKGRTAR